MGRDEGGKVWVGREDTEDRVGVEEPGEEMKEETEAVLDGVREPGKVRV